MRSVRVTLFTLVLLLTLSACVPSGQASPAQPTPDQALIASVSQRVAALYGETHPHIDRVTQSVSEGSAQQPINFVFLSGNFHQGALRAPGLSFTMLATGKEVWAVRAFDAQNQTIWITQQVSI
jgi:outer membrane lipoprotein-sorting protein